MIPGLKTSAEYGPEIEIVRNHTYSDAWATQMSKLAAKDITKGNPITTVFDITIAACHPDNTLLSVANFYVMTPAQVEDVVSHALEMLREMGR